MNTRTLNVRIPVDIHERIEQLADAGARAWPRQAKQHVVATLLARGLDALAGDVAEQATARKRIVRGAGAVSRAARRAK